MELASLRVVNSTEEKTSKEGLLVELHNGATQFIRHGKERVVIRTAVRYLYTRREWRGGAPRTPHLLMYCHTTGDVNYN